MNKIKIRPNWIKLRASNFNIKDWKTDIKISLLVLVGWKTKKLFKNNRSIKKYKF